jgi:hypothetical protein
LIVYYLYGTYVQKTGKILAQGGTMANCIDEAHRVLALRQDAYIKDCNKAIQALKDGYDALDKKQKSEARDLYWSLNNLIEWLKVDEDV